MSGAIILAAAVVGIVGIVIGIILAMGLPQAWLNHLKKKEKKAI